MDYELVVLTTTEIGKKVEGDVERAVGAKAKITKTDDWGTKALAYKILKQTEGNYFFFALTLEPSEVSPIDESLRRNENILRHLLVKAEKHKKKVTKPSLEVPKAKKEVKKAAVKKISTKKK